MNKFDKFMEEQGLNTPAALVKWLQDNESKNPVLYRKMLEEVCELALKR